MFCALFCATVGHDHKYPLMSRKAVQEGTYDRAQLWHKTEHRTTNQNNVFCLCDTAPCETDEFTQ